MNGCFLHVGRGNSKNLFSLAFLIREMIKRGIPMCNEALDFLRRYNMSSGIIGGYNVANGYMGYVDGKYVLFASEQDYRDYINQEDE